MGEHNLPKPVLVRPDAALLGMRMAVSASKSEMVGMDPDTRDFMADLERVIAWIDHLEKTNPPAPALNA